MMTDGVKGHELESWITEDSWFNKFFFRAKGRVMDLMLREFFFIHESRKQNLFSALF